MRRQLLPALRMTIALTVLLGLAYPIAMTGVAQALFRSRADGSFVRTGGAVVGSELIGQSFAQPVEIAVLRAVLGGDDQIGMRGRPNHRLLDGCRRCAGRDWTSSVGRLREGDRGRQ